MPASYRKKNQHLLWRAGFGPMAEHVASLDHVNPKDLWNALQITSKDSPEKIIVSEGMLDLFGVGKAASPEERQAMARQRRLFFLEQIKALNLDWLFTMVNSAAQLREKMSLFWHGHFAAKVINGYFNQELLHTIRQHSLGNFGELLRAVSKSPAMLQFLNNQQNRKARPNENFAREVMELFTMGRGNYTEADVKEAARAFTGWGFDAKGQFVFRKNQHDEGEKTFLGEKGNFNGDDIINILLKQKATARFITTKIYQFFVNEENDEKIIAQLSEQFFQSNYNISQLLDTIFSSDWFYAEKNMGIHIKSPVELLVGIRRFLPMQLKNPDVLLQFQRALGQTLFSPPNVAGWPGGKHWIDSSTLMLRMQIPQSLSGSRQVQAAPKPDDDIEMGKEQVRPLQMNALAPAINWYEVYKIFENTKRENLMAAIGETLLQTGKRPGDKTILQFTDNSSREAFIQSAIINIMSTPEYQLS